MVQPGDTVRYLNAVGGGKVTRVEGNIAYVDDDGFETPVQAKELVVVLPAGHEPSKTGARKMFDQEAYDAGKGSERKKPKPEAPKEEPKKDSAASFKPEPQIGEEEFPLVETDYGDDMTLVLAFEPQNVKDLEHCRIAVMLVNDSNYFVRYVLLRRADTGKGWVAAAEGETAPNEVVDLGSVTQEGVNKFERIVFQAIAYKRDKAFEVQAPLHVSRKIDLTKFHKMHCFRPGVYFESPVMEITLYSEKR